MEYSDLPALSNSFILARTRTVQNGISLTFHSLRTKWTNTVQNTFIHLILPTKPTFFI